MLASVVINRARDLLLDPSPGTYWTDANILDYLNAAIRAVVTVRPSSNIVTTTFTLTQNSALQTVPSGASQFLGVTRNLSPSITAITQTDKRHLDAADPDWYNISSTTAVENFVVMDDDPKYFYVYPIPAISNMSVEIRYVAHPTVLTASSDTIPIDDTYETALLEYVLSMAYSKNSKRGDVTKASYHMQASINFLGLKDAGEIQKYVKFTDTSTAV